MPKGTDKFDCALICLLLAVGTVVSFWNVGHAGFVNYDDPMYVSANPIVQEGLTVQNAKWALTAFEYHNWHPLTWLSYMLDYELFGLNPRGFHLTNLALHLANTLLVFLCFLRTTGALWASALIAAFFGWHPLHVESVAWISERKDVLSTFFGLLSICAYTLFVSRRAGGWYLATLVLFVCSLMSKAMLVTLPFVLLLLDLWPLGRFNLNTPGWPAAAWKLIREKLPLFAVAALVSYWAYLAQGEAVRSTDDLMLSLRIENSLVSYARYLGKAFWPVNLAVFYPHPPDGWAWWQVIGSGALILVLSALAVLTIRHRPWFFVGWFWFMGTLVPVIGLVQVGSQSIADRYMYVPVIGLAIAVVWAMRETVAVFPRMKTLTAGLAAGALTMCGVATARQVHHWRNSVTLFQHTERTARPSIVTLNNLIAALLQQGQVRQAHEYTLKALDLFPHENFAWWNAGDMFMRQGKFDAALEHYQQALRLNPHDPQSLFSMGVALEQQNKNAEAADYFRQTLARKPRHAEAHWRLGLVLARLGKTAEARRHYEQSIKINPRDAAAHLQLASLLAELQEPEAAVAAYREALRLNPGLPPALNNLAWLLATHPDSEQRNGVEAVRLAERACEINQWRQPFFLGTLAAAYAEAGRFDEAVMMADKAVALAELQGEKRLADKNRELLNHYKARRPWREALQSARPSNDKAAAN